MRSRLIATAALAAATVTSCAHPQPRSAPASAQPPLATVRSARLYPANDLARAGGVLSAQFIDSGTGHGPIEMTMPDGEVLKGEYSVVRGAAVQFGSIFESVYGPGGIATGTGTTSNYAMPGSSTGAASAFGNKGTSMDCEFYNDNVSGHGMGACKNSRGALYRLQYWS
jgi:hypothetical protein